MVRLDKAPRATPPRFPVNSLDAGRLPRVLSKENEMLFADGVAFNLINSRDLGPLWRKWHPAIFG